MYPQKYEGTYHIHETILKKKNHKTRKNSGKFKNIITDFFKSTKGMVDIVEISNED